MTRRRSGDATTRLDDTVFLVNPASANGIDGPALAGARAPRRARGLDGRHALLRAARATSATLAREAAPTGARSCSSSSAATGRVNEVANGVAGREDVEIAVIPRGTGWDFVRTYGIPAQLDGAVDVALDAADRARSTSAASATAPGTASDAGRWFANVASVGHERCDRPARQRDDEGARRQGLLPLGDARRLRRWQSSELRLSVDDEIRERARCTTSSSRTAAPSAAG